MSDPIDPTRVGIQLDRAEEAGAIETDVAAWLRERTVPILERMDVEVQPWAGCTIEAASEHAAAVCRRLGVTVHLLFNGERIACHPGDVPDQVFERYLTALDRPRPFTVDIGRDDG